MCIKFFSMSMLPPIQLVLKKAAAMPLDACKPPCFCTHAPANVPPCLGVCVAVAAPWALFQWMYCLCVPLHVRGWVHACGTGHICGV